MNFYVKFDCEQSRFNVYSYSFDEKRVSIACGPFIMTSRSYTQSLRRSSRVELRRVVRLAIKYTTYRPTKWDPLRMWCIARKLVSLVNSLRTTLTWIVRKWYWGWYTIEYKDACPLRDYFLYKKEIRVYWSLSRTCLISAVNVCSLLGGIRCWFIVFVH